MMVAGGPWRNNVQVLGLLPALLVTAVGFHIASGGRFLSPTNASVLLHQVAINLVLASGMTVVILAGGIDLSVSAILAVSVTAGLLTSHVGVLSPLWPLVSILAGSCCGLVNGVLVARLRLPPFILTLASLTVWLGIARAMTGDMTVYSKNLPYAWLGSGSILGVPALAILGGAVIVTSWGMLTRTVFGVFIYAVGCNRVAASLSGIDVPRIDIVSYGISGLLSGMAGVMLASKLHGANAMQIGQSYTLDAITAVILGGTSFAGGVGSIWGTATGALLIVALSNGLLLTGVTDMWQAVVKGVLIIGAVAIDHTRLTMAARS